MFVVRAIIIYVALSVSLLFIKMEKNPLLKLPSIFTLGRNQTQNEHVKIYELKYIYMIIDINICFEYLALLPNNG